MFCQSSLDLREVAIIYISLVISLSVHEWAHAWSAHLLGDDTAAEHGRLTFNPLAHIDPIGTVVLPLVLLFQGSSFFFGWAKPVPVNPFGFRRGITVFKGMLITSLAGPFSNLVLALICGLAMRVLDRFFDPSNSVILGLFFARRLNVILAIFNMLPVPPLDGHRMLPLRIQDALRPYTMLVFIGLIVLIQFSGGILLVPVKLLDGWIEAFCLLLI